MMEEVKKVQKCTDDKFDKITEYLLKLTVMTQKLSE